MRLLTARPIPWLFVSLAVAATVVQFHDPTGTGWRASLLYDRAAVGGGDWWRIWTGHLVHFGWPHFFTDTGLFLVLGWLLEGQYRLLSWFLLVTLPAVISGSLYFLDPTMTHYGGLSAVNLGLLVFLACNGWQKNWFDWFWPAVLAIYVGEIVLETHFKHGRGGGMIAFDDKTVRVATSAHIAGAVFAALVWAVRAAWRRAHPPAQTDAG